MKKLFYAACFVSLLTSCASGPDKVAKNFMESIAKGDMKEAAEYATPATANILQMVSSMKGSLPTSDGYTCKIIKDSISGDHAWVTLINPEGKEEVVDLVKTDGKWLVTMKK